MRRLALIASLAALAALTPGTAFGGGRIVFKPTVLPVGHVGIRYQVVIQVSVAGHHPAFGKDYPSYTVACFGADPQGGYIDDCAKLPPGVRLAPYEGPGCAPPLQKPDCVILSGKPRKAGTYTFRISAPDVNSVGVRGILRKYTLVIRA